MMNLTHLSDFSQTLCSYALAFDFPKYVIKIFVLGLLWVWIFSVTMQVKVMKF